MTKGIFFSQLAANFGGWKLGAFGNPIGSSIDRLFGAFPILNFAVRGNPRHLLPARRTPGEFVKCTGVRRASPLKAVSPGCTSGRSCPLIKPAFPFFKLALIIPMLALSALLPCLVVIIAILWFRQSAVVAATAAAFASGLLWAAGVFLPPTVTQVMNALTDTAILQLLVAAIVLPGIMFVETSNRTGAPKAIGDVMKHLNLKPPRAAIVIAIGFGVLVESLTGYGVSLLVTVPLLAARFERRHAIALALLGMSLMPWGALSVSAHLGAELAEIALDRMALMIWLVSGPVVFILPLLCLRFVPDPCFGDFIFAFLAGLLLWAGIGLGSRWIGIEIAGVAGAFTVIAMAVLAANGGDGLIRVFATRALAPYYLLIASVLLQKLLILHLAEAGVAPVLSSGRVTFSLLSSPGVALLMAILPSIMLLPQASASPIRISALLVHVWQRGWRPMGGIFLFVLAARLLVEMGAIKALAGLLSTTGPYPALAAVTLLGATSGFVTGSGLTGNALFMPSAATTGASFDAPALFAALQHGAAGHMAMAALPVAAILLAALPGRTFADDRTVLVIGLRLNLIFMCLLIGMGSLLLFFGIG